MTNIHEDNTTGEPDAAKAARQVRKGTERKGFGNNTSLSVYLTLQLERFAETRLTCNAKMGVAEVH